MILQHAASCVFLGIVLLQTLLNLRLDTFERSGSQ